MKQGVPPVGPNLSLWANDLRRWLSRTMDSLTFKTAGAGAPADQDGVMLWDAAGGYPVVSKNGEWRQVVLADGYAMAAITSTVTAAAINTAYALTWDSVDAGSGISFSGSDVTFAEGGNYLITFTAQIRSSTSSTVKFWFWPRVNGSNMPGSTMKASLHANDATIVVARSALFNFSAGDVLTAMWAVDDTNGTLTAQPAETFSPATPAVTMTITRVSA